MDPKLIDAGVDLFQKVGFAALVAAYFMWRDYKYTGRQTDAAERIATSLAVLSTKLDSKPEGDNHAQ
jgi:hypothetical protein